MKAALCGLALAALLTSLGAQAQVLPAPLPPTPSGCVASRFGGCIGPWVSVAPVVVVVPVAINLRTKLLEAGFQPGLCYGAQIHNEAWWGFGISACGNLNVGAQTAAFGLMGSLLHGWLQFGWDKGFIGDSNATAPRLLFGIGQAIP